MVSSRFTERPLTGIQLLAESHGIDKKFNEENNRLKHRKKENKGKKDLLRQVEISIQYTYLGVRGIQSWGSGI